MIIITKLFITNLEVNDHKGWLVFTCIINLYDWLLPLMFTLDQQPQPSAPSTTRPAAPPLLHTEGIEYQGGLKARNAGAVAVSGWLWAISYRTNKTISYIIEN